MDAPDKSNTVGNAPITTSRVVAVTAADIATGAVGTIVVVGIVALALRQQPIPTELGLALPTILAYYFGRSSRV